MFHYFRKHKGSIIAAFSRGKRKSSLSSRGRNGRHAQHCRLNIETLEHRWMLSNGPIVINELHVDPNIKTEPVEYIELYNASATTVNLSGWNFSNGVGYTFPSGTQLAANQYLVVSENPAAVQTKYGVSSLGPFTGKLSNEGETVTLCDSSGTVQDEVTYGMGFPWPTVGDDPGNSMELINPALDNNLGGSWRSSISVPVTRQTLFGLNSTWRYFKGTAEPSATQGLWRQLTGFSDASWLSGQAAIGYGNDADEQGWIKTALGDMNGGYSSVYFRKTFNVSNLTTITSLLLEMRYDDGINVWINGHYVANANVTAENLAYNATAVSSIEADELVPITLNNPASYLVAGNNVIAVQLLNCAKSDVDAFFDAQLTAIYTTKAGVTPGAKNSVYAANAPPQIRQVDNSPKQPAAGQNVVITAKVTDPDGVAGVQLKYQLVNPGDYIAINDDRYNDPAQWNTATMYDDGTHGDAIAADGVYTAVLPGTLQTNRLLVRYRISSTDSLGASITTPYADDPQPNFAYYVYNGIPDWTAAVQPGVTTPVTYPSSLLNQLPALQLLTTKTAHDDAQHIPNSTTAAYTGSDYLWYGTLIYNGVVYDDISYRARGGVWRYAMGKNMWKFDFNRGHEFQPLDNYGQPYGVKWKKLNLSAIIQQGNYWHRGEQGLFESVGFELFNLAGVPAENTSFVGFRIVENASETGSNQYSTDFQGMYLMVEQPDGNLLDEHGLPDGNLYKMESGTGTSNNQGPTQVSDGSDLASFLNTYNNTTPTAQWWSDNLDLNEYYSYRAIVEGIHQYDIAAGKNYFYYHNPDTNKWEVLPWDLDLTWANNMYGTGNEPFLSRVLASSQTTFNQDYRNRMREIRDLLYNPEQTGMLIDEMASFIYTPGQLSWVDADCAMWDYNPIMTSSYVTASKAGAGLYYSDGAGDLPTHNFAGMIQLMKNYVASRGAWIDSTILTDNAQIPNKPTATYMGQSGYPLDQLSFKASVYSSPVGSAASAMQWRIAKVTDTSSPNYDPNAPRDYEITALWESGELPVSTSTVAIPGNALEIGATYRVRVRMKDAAGRWSHWSDAVQFVAAAPAVPLNNYLRITEIMYNPPAPTAAEIAAGYTDNNSFEYVELTNTGSSNLQLSGVKFTKGVTFTFGNATLQPGQRVLVVNNAAAFTFRYGTGYNIAGTYSGKFDNSGEEVKLESASGVVQDFTYDDNDPWPGRADGNGSSLEVKNTAGDYNDPDNWRSSSEYGGSPGRAGIGPIHEVVVNEVLSHTDYPLYDSIELYNTTSAAVNISGWYLSDSSDDYKKYRIPDGTVLAPYEYLVYTAEQFGVYFGLSSTGDDVWLMQADALGNLTYFADHVDFGAAKNGESFGRWPNGTGNLYPMQNRTLGQANDAGGNGPRIGPLLISEVMYNPSVSAGQNPDDYEYIEIFNPTAAAVDLTHWLIGQGVDFAFSAGTTIGANEALLVLPFDPTDLTKLNNFKSKYGIGSSVKLVGSFTGHLDNGGETVQLLRPDTPNGTPPTYPALIEDEINYDNASPWPTAADGGGDSLQRVSAAAWGDDAASWIAAAPTPGTAHVSALVGRNIFYNNSKFDAHMGYTSGDPAINDYDDNAIASDKTALLPGHTATFVNYTSYSRGINGIMVDILDPDNPGGINATDFQFKVGNGGSWITAPAPSYVLERQGKGVGGSDRVTITWDDNVIQNQWLQVTVLADANTGLADADVFYFGNAVGESGDSPANAVVDPQDETASRTHKTGFTTAAITNPYDYNRDGRVNAADDLIARYNKTDGSSANPPLQLITPIPAVVSRYVFYNDSRFDGHTGYIDGDPAANIYDDNSIATDKQALLPGQIATFANYTSYSRGINGIMIDIQYPENMGGISAADFQFNVGNGGAWTTAPAPRYVLERQGKGAGNSDRVTITWDDNVIQNQWLQVTVLADANTGLSAANVFYFGNAIGESGDSPANAVVDPQDETASRTHKTGFSAAAITNLYDYNRDGRVNAADDLIARHNRTDGAGGNPLQLIAAPVGAPLAAGDILQPLPAVADIAITQAATTVVTTSKPTTTSADTADLLPVTLPAAVDIVASQSAALLEDNRISQPAYATAEIAVTQAEMSSATVEIATASPIFTSVQTAFAPGPLLACPAVMDFASFSRPSMAVQFPGFLYSQDMAGNSNLLSASRDAVTSNQWISRQEYGNQMFMLGRGDQTSRTALRQDRLHDAVFARSIAQFSLTEEDGLPDDSIVPADVETFLKDCLPAKSHKSFAHAIDTFFAVPRHNME